MKGVLSASENMVSAVLAAARWLSLPVAVLLFLQWPLRDGLQRYSREANDLGQICFAVFVACAVVAATRAHRHIATTVVVERLGPSIRLWLERLGIVIGLLPWLVFVGWAAVPILRQSIAFREHFPDTGNPGYFILRSALGLMLAMVLLQALIDLSRGSRRNGDAKP